MHLYALPLIFILIGLVLYVVLGGADFGAGFWQLAAGRGERAERLREHAHHSMGPVWEANHVWLIFVLTVMWTAYPVAFGSIASTLALPLFVAAIGIIIRGTAYALRMGASGPRERAALETASGVSSILTPFSLGLVAGAIAAGRVPVGNAAGDQISSWLSPVPLVIGVLAVSVSAYMAAVFLAADAARHDQPELEQEMRLRGLVAGLVAGAVAVAGLVVLHADVHRLYSELTSGAPLVVAVISALSGLATLALLAARRYEACRYTAALAVAAVIAAWAIAQSPVILPGLTVAQAAAPHDVLVAVTVAVLAGALILFPSLALLFRLFLGGRLSEPAASPEAAQATTGRARTWASPGTLARVAGALLLAGVGLLNAADAPLAHLFGVLCLLAFIAVAFSS
ncbi:MAG TPA: cytochrome d ubiquinol oxidase subunit II, partial [Solirubrobacteraceae bacterium]